MSVLDKTLSQKKIPIVWSCQAISFEEKWLNFINMFLGLSDVF